MDAEDRPKHMMPHDDELDSATAELLRRVYARHIDIDTAARHLWVIDAAARTARQARHTMRGARGRGRRAVVSLMMSLMLIGSSGMAVAASDGTLPGDSLYGVKRSTERIKLVLAVRADADAQMQLDIARQRWAEAQRAARDRPEVVSSLLRDTFQALDAAEANGGVIARHAHALRLVVAEGSTELALGQRDRRGRPEADARRGPSASSAGTPPTSPPADGTDGEGEPPAAATDEEETAAAAPPPPPRESTSPPPPATSTSPASTETSTAEVDADPDEENVDETSEEESAGPDGGDGTEKKPGPGTDPDDGDEGVSKESLDPHGNRSPEPEPSPSPSSPEPQ